jgi:hypothetical protein
MHSGLEEGLERFHNSHTLAGIVQGGIFLRKMPLDSSAFGVDRLWNRCSGVIGVTSGEVRPGLGFRSADDPGL